MLRWRLLLGTLIIAVLVALCWLDIDAEVPGLWLLPVAVLVVLLASREFLDLAALAQLRPLRWPVYAGNVLLVASSWLVILKQHWRRGFPLNWGYIEYGWEIVVLLALAAAVLLVLSAEMWRYRSPGGNLANVAGGVFALIYVGLMLSFAVQLRLVWGVGALASWIIVVKMGDTGAYAAGRLIGRHKMAPLISPGKTIEGAIGNLIFSCLGAWLTFRWLFPSSAPESVWPGPWWGWIAYGLLLGTAGMVGDLAESLLKRDVGRKDSSDWLPGFGGVLDILDSLLLSAPVAWFCWASGMVGR
jgi:phosphatidate cytidylyltransferase